MSNKNFNPLQDLHTALLEEKACESHGDLHQSKSREEAALWWETFQQCSTGRRQEHIRWMVQHDLYFFLRFVSTLANSPEFISFIDTEWGFDRCKEVQADPDNHIDLWSRGGGKSTIITFAKTIQDILNDPNQTFLILSHTKPIARAFLRQIKTELETNQLLKDCFSDILYQDPAKESPKWSEEEGITVKRSSNPKEQTVEAYGLVDGQPTSKHAGKIIYDDVIDEKAVTTPQMIEKVTKAWELSLNLAGGQDRIKFRVAGTFYAVGDTYHVMIERGFGKLRVRPIVIGSKSLLLSDERLALLKQSMSPRTWTLQILLNPTQSDEERGFKKEWLKHWKTRPNIKSLNRYILVDPAGKGEESTSLCAFIVVGLGADRHKYVLHMMKDRMGLVERANLLFELHREYNPLSVIYERYSMQSDIEHIKDKQQRENYHFNIIEVGAIGTQLSKDRRIEKLQPDCANGLILFPPFGTIRVTMHDGKEYDMVERFVNKEYLAFPYTQEKDFLDALSRMYDPMVTLTFPRSYGSKERNEHWRGGNNYDSGSWMAG